MRCSECGRSLAYFGYYDYYCLYCDSRKKNLEKSKSSSLLEEIEDLIRRQEDCMDKLESVIKPSIYDELKWIYWGLDNIKDKWKNESDETS